MPIGSNILAGASGQATGYDIEQSLRFNDDDSAKLTRTPGSAGSLKKWTISTWVKRGNLSDGVVISAGTYSEIKFSSDTLYVGVGPTNSTQFALQTSAVYRDPSAWYHIVVAADTTQASASNRLKLYVNGEEVTAFAVDQRSLISQDVALTFTGAYEHRLGVDESSAYFDGLIAETILVDGSQLTSATFGETNEDTNQWQAIKYAGSYGDNGFYLKFQDSSALGDDSSGNTNDFSATNLVATDQVLDSPTNNFATLNPLATQTTPLSEGNLRKSTSDTKSNMSTIGVSSGKWYWEVYPETNNWGIGLVNDTETRQSASGSTTVAVLYSDVTSTGTPNSTETYDNFSSVSAGDIISIALDVDSETITFYQNNTRIFEADTFTIDGPFFPAIDRGTGATNNITINFGQDSSFAGAKTAQGNTDGNGYGDFFYEVPTSFKALCSKNLPDPSIADPSAHFSGVTWSGDDSASRSINAGLAPDFVWYKDRTGTESNSLYDSVRGAQKRLISNSTDLERTRSTGLLSFDSTGFTVGADTECNGSGKNYVGYSWKLGGAPTVDNSAGAGATPTAGSVKIDGANLGSALAGTIAATRLSANTTSGMSALVYNGNATAGATVAHGLSQAPELVINKVRGSATQWYVNATAVSDTSNKVLMLNATDALDSGTFYFNDTDPTATLITLGYYGNLNSTGSNLIFCWHSVPGFSAIGKYSGTGSTSGPFIYTGFSVGFVMIKCYAGSSSQEWAMFDNKRSSYNVVDDYLYADKNSAEASGSDRELDFVSNGIKFRGPGGPINVSGRDYIYLAFAESPFKYSNAR